MRLTVISSLDAECRVQATHILAAGHTRTIIVQHDLQEDGVVVRRLLRDGVIVEHEENPLEHGCLSCTVRLDVVPTVARLVSGDYDHVVVAPPPGVESAMAVQALRAGLGSAAVIDSVVLACDPGSLEERIWDHHTLFESGFTPTSGDERTPGEFLIGELAFADTVLLTTTGPATAADPATATARDRGTRLIRELAPHATLSTRGTHFPVRRFDGSEAGSRLAQGSVRIPVIAASGPFNTVLLRAERPLHPERFRTALASLAAGNHWLRGRLWIASAPRCRIAIQGIGPRVWIESTGPWLAEREPGSRGNPLDNVEATLDWHPVHGDRGTVVAVTGENLHAADLSGLLAACELSADAMDAGFSHLHDPFELNSTL